MSTLTRLDSQDRNISRQEQLNMGVGSKLLK